MNSRGKQPYNAETMIDYETRNISFNYPQDISERNDRYAYANHTIAQLVGAFLGAFLFLKVGFFLVLATVLYLDLVIEINPMVNLALSILLFIFIYLILMFISIRAVGGISLLLHQNSKKLRDIYPRTNAFFQLFGVWLKKKLGVNQKIDFSDPMFDDEPTITKKFLFTDNKLFIKNNIAYSEYELYGECSKYIKKIYTRCYETDPKKRNKVSVSKFMTVFEFNKKPKDGSVIIW